MVKPFEPLELRARIGTKLKRRPGNDAGQILRKGQITVYPPFQKCLITQRDVDQEIELTPNEFKLLLFHDP